jgi:hypothetical protein
MGRHKRQRGGQPGNQNARKHGFYAVHLTPQEIAQFWNILNNGVDEPELVVLRIKTANLTKYAPGNPRMLRELRRLIYKWGISKYGYSRKTLSDFRTAIRMLFTPIEGKTNISPEPTEAKS